MIKERAAEEEKNAIYYERWKKMNDLNYKQLVHKIANILCCDGDGTFCIADEKSDAYQCNYVCSNHKYLDKAAKIVDILQKI